VDKDIDPIVLVGKPLMDPVAVPAVRVCETVSDHVASGSGVTVVAVGDHDWVLDKLLVTVLECDDVLECDRVGDRPDTVADCVGKESVADRDEQDTDPLVGDKVTLWVRRVVALGLAERLCVIPSVCDVVNEIDLDSDCVGDVV
jgi:hypothetical protein